MDADADFHVVRTDAKIIAAGLRQGAGLERHADGIGAGRGLLRHRFADVEAPAFVTGRAGDLEDEDIPGHASAPGAVLARRR